MGAGMGIGMVVGMGVGMGVGGGVGAKATRLTVAESWFAFCSTEPVGIPVILPVRCSAAMRLHFCEAFMADAVGLASYMMAASPETCAQAMEVPEEVPTEMSLPMNVEMTSVPGAQTSTQEP
jgi:hypothetical protein